MRRGDVSDVRLALLDPSVNVNLHDEGDHNWIALQIIACENEFDDEKHVEVAKELLARGAQAHLTRKKSPGTRSIAPHITDDYNRGIF